MPKIFILDPGCFHCQNRNKKGKCVRKSSNSSLCANDIDGTVCIRNNETQEHCEYEGKYVYSLSQNNSFTAIYVLYINAY